MTTFTPVRQSKGPAPSNPGGDRPRLLFLCQALPFPPDGGVHIRSYNILRLLARSFDVTALCFYRQATRPTEADIEESLEGLRRVAAVVEAFPIPQERSRARLLWDHARSALFQRVYTRYAYDSLSFTTRLKELLATRSFDLVHVDSMDLSGYLPLLETIPVVCTHHNVESALLQRRADSENSLIIRAYFRLQAHLMEKEERKWCGRVAMNVAVSREDREVLRSIAPGARFTIVPNGVDTRKFIPGVRSSGKADGMVFVGGYSWFPNRDAMEYFCGAILPHIRELRQDSPVTWVGRTPPQVQAAFETKFGVRVTGYVDDIRPFVHEAECYVVPIRVGGGTRLKILDAWAMGKAVVSTTIGCEGLDAREGENILVRDDPREFAEAVIQVLENAELRKRLARGARETVERIYEWDVIEETMASDYRAAMRTGPHAVPARP